MTDSKQQCAARMNELSAQITSAQATDSQLNDAVRRLDEAYNRIEDQKNLLRRLFESQRAGFFDHTGWHGDTREALSTRVNQNLNGAQDQYLGGFDRAQERLLDAKRQLQNKITDNQGFLGVLQSAWNNVSVEWEKWVN